MDANERIAAAFERIATAMEKQTQLAEKLAKKLDVMDPFFQVVSKHSSKLAEKFEEELEDSL
jgi:hypothetical protein